MVCTIRDLQSLQHVAQQCLPRSWLHSICMLQALQIAQASQSSCSCIILLSQAFYKVMSGRNCLRARLQCSLGWLCRKLCSAGCYSCRCPTSPNRECARRWFPMDRLELAQPPSPLGQLQFVHWKSSSGTLYTPRCGWVYRNLSSCRGRPYSLPTTCISVCTDYMHASSNCRSEPSLVHVGTRTAALVNIAGPAADASAFQLLHYKSNFCVVWSIAGSGISGRAVLFCNLCD